jgi:NAD(P)H-flavin reductase
MVKPRRTRVFLGRPLSVASFDGETLGFVVSIRGQGTRDLEAMRPGEEAELSGPLGNAFGDFLRFFPEGSMSVKGEAHIALVGGGDGVIPLILFAHALEHVDRRYDFYAGFKNGLWDFSSIHPSTPPVMATEDGSSGKKGFVTDYLPVDRYYAVFGCGPVPFLRTLAGMCKNSGVLCFVSMEKHMACGVGACLGCTIHTKKGNRRCCKDGPVFNAEEVVFDE